MLRTRALEVSLWEAVLPGEVLRLPGEQARPGLGGNQAGRRLDAIQRPDDSLMAHIEDGSSINGPGAG
jgi:hypothetical protein